MPGAEARIRRTSRPGSALLPSGQERRCDERSPDWANLAPECSLSELQLSVHGVDVGLVRTEIARLERGLGVAVDRWPLVSGSTARSCPPTGGPPAPVPPESARSNPTGGGDTGTEHLGEGTRHGRSDADLLVEDRDDVASWGSGFEELHVERANVEHALIERHHQVVAQAGRASRAGRAG